MGVTTRNDNNHTVTNNTYGNNSETMYLRDNYGLHGVIVITSDYDNP
jgi:hypothetical protein